ncbi:hypothetical protein [Aneurinibacillus tyrosinisolvens]|uniref:hypothetical protein n=1 Tax=Aneurinibacillus tyrosinisolvens TaxID=1443435 RepID=UPI00063F0196|nr:hypothetical protein [Aneurinibacillus tyrosinisolvens]
MKMHVERLVIGTALALSASVILPIAKATLSTAGRVGGKAAAGTWSGLRTTLQTAREEVEDMVAEAQFERMSKRLDKEIME